MSDERNFDQSSDVVEIQPEIEAPSDDDGTGASTTMGGGGLEAGIRVVAEKVGEPAGEVVGDIVGGIIGSLLDD
jgi:hypothetical protein